MIDSISIMDIEKIIPILLKYILPGFIFLSFRNYSYSKDYNKDKYFIIKCIVTSYIFVQIKGFLFYPDDSSIDNINVNFCFIIFVCLVSYGYIFFRVEDKFNHHFLCGKTINADTFNNIIADESGKTLKNSMKGVWIKAYIKGEDIMYSGALDYFDENVNNSERLFTLSEFIRCDYEGNIKDDNSKDINSRVILSMKDVYRLEVIKDSTVENIEGVEYTQGNT